MTAGTEWTDAYWNSRDGLRLHYRDYPGPAGALPVVCLHGLTRNARDFEELAPQLARDRRVIVPDFRGRGLSDYDPIPARYAPPTYAADILQLLELLEIESATFIGTSLGGLVTMAIAAFAPQRIAGTVLNDVGPELEREGLDRIRGYVGRPAFFRNWKEAADSIAERNGALHPRYRHADWMKMARRLCREEAGGVIFDYDLAIAQNVLASASAPQADAWPYFAALASSPLLVLRGELSDLLSAETAARMVESHPDARLVTVADVGHAPDLLEPEALAAIHQLLESSPR
jgi:pimeloyl-ACP methyl ester carboxylesterase